MKRRPRILLYLIPLLAGWLLFAVFLNSARQEPEKIAQGISDKIASAENRINTKLVKSRQLLNQSGVKGLFENLNYYRDDIEAGIYYFGYKADSLLFWSSTAAAVDNIMRDVCLDSRLAKTRNGYYLVFQDSANATSEYRLYALFLIRHNYAYQNNYLENSFNPYFGLHQQLLFSLAPAEKLKPVVYKSENLFYVSGTQQLLPGMFFGICLFSAFLVLLVFSFVIAYRVLKELQMDTLFIVPFAVVLFRLLMLLIGWPNFIYETSLYDPAIYGNADSVLNPFLGDVLLNALSVFFILRIIKFHLPVSRFTPGQGLFIGYLILLFFTGILVNSLVKGLISNASISYDLTELFSLTVFSVVSLMIIIIVFVSVYQIFSIGADLFFAGEIRKTGKLVALTIAGALSVLGHHLMGYYDVLLACWIFVAFGIIALLKRIKENFFFTYGMVVILILSFIATRLILINKNKKEEEVRAVYADLLSNPQDLVAENLFADLCQKLKSDTLVKRLIRNKPVQGAEIEKRLRQNYFSGYWEKYSVRFSLMDSLCVPVVKNENDIYNNNTYYDEQINKSTPSSLCPNLFFNQPPGGKPLYVAKVPIRVVKDSTVKPYELYAELEQKISETGLGFPELLLDKSLKQGIPLEKYSFALYKSGRLVYQSGQRLFDERIVSERGLNETRHRGKLHELIFSPDQETTLILSRTYDFYYDYFTTNSYLFLVFSVLFVLYLLYREFLFLRKKGNTSFSLRLQLFLTISILILLSVFGVGTWVFVQKEFEERNYRAIEEKMVSVRKELLSQLGGLNELPILYKDYVTYLLQRTANIFQTDIIFYDYHGNMFASSQPALFEKGILLAKMNPVAYYGLWTGDLSKSLINESAGNLSYSSAYQKFSNYKGEMLGFLNLPYFSKQAEKEKELSAYLATLINIYVVLFAISTIAALVISNLITEPIRILRQQMSKLKLGNNAEPIEWKENDEIGELIREYNLMIVKLGESAKMLAQSERESAWREMAKQVAHEIKNPLTPMKLSVQHLQRTVMENPDEIEERVNKVSDLLLEQIDTLAHIANEFSAFAKMPKAEIAEVNLMSLLLRVTELFRSAHNCNLELYNETGLNLNVLADHDQLLRVFNNLLKNAIQAIPSAREPRISVYITASDGRVLIKISDNGTGIPDEAKGKIFTPNFSTKTDGMGLGLAMVKNIVESFSGKIWFETIANEGTTFFVELPLLQKV